MMHRLMKITIQKFLVIVLLFVFSTVNAATYTWTGSTSTDYQVSSNWSPSRTPATTDDIIISPSSGGTIAITNVPSQTINSLTINGSGIVTLAGSFNTLTFQSGGSLNIASGTTLNMGTMDMVLTNSTSTGYLTTSGTGSLITAASAPLPYTTTSNSHSPDYVTFTFDVTYNGSSLQTIGYGTYTNFTLNSSIALGIIAANIAGGDATISGTLTLTSGILACGTSTPRNLIFTSSASCSGASSSTGWVYPANGTVVRQSLAANNSFVFPLGTLSNYMPATITNKSGTRHITTSLITINPDNTNTKIARLQWSIKGDVATTIDATFLYNASYLGSQYNPTATNDLGVYQGGAYSTSNVGTATSVGSNNYTVSPTNLSILTTTSYYYVANTGMLSSLSVPGAPTIGTATCGPVGSSGVTASVTFTPPTTGGPVTNFTVTSNPGGLTKTGTSSPIIVTGLTNATAYTFTVTASNGSGTGTASSASAAITTGAVTTTNQPSNFIPTPSNGQISLAFTKPSGTITNYKYSLDGGFNYTSVGNSTIPITITGLSNGNIYNLALLGVTAAGDGLADHVGVIVPSTTPAAPTITGITAGNAQLSIAFTAGSTGGATILNYKYSTDGGSSFTACSPAQVSSPILITGLVNAT